MRRVETLVRFFLFLGVACLGFYGLDWLEASLSQKRALESLAAQTERRPSRRVREDPPPAPGSVLGRIVIPRIALSAAILEGVDNKTLRRGIGHVPGTALPGERGNFALAGHRDGFSRPLKRIQAADRIRLITPRASYEYVVDWIQVVDPDDVEVLEPSNKPILTLVTCYPFSYLGSAPKRFIVRARRLARSGSLHRK